MQALLCLLLVTLQAPNLQRHEWEVDGVKREGLVYVPSKPADSPAPVVFAFHGHGGTMQNSARRFRYQEHWPEAIVVYLQGLPTPGQLTDPTGRRAGWQRTSGDQGDRDLKLFDTVLKWLREKHKIDDRRIYVTGHSNGGGFTYLLWATRHDFFAAAAPAAAGGRVVTQLKPLPALHVAGEADQLVSYRLQQRAMEAVRKINGCDADGKEWSKHCTWYSSKTGTPFVAYVHPGDHAFPEEAAPVIVKFFKEHTKPISREKPE